MNFTKNIGMLLLAIYLILVGIMALTAVGIPPVLTGILALAAGIFILIGR
jgi:asparagine N-glycosylation enzyme membrane subunit Stt3